MQLEAIKTDGESQILAQEAAIKRELMQQEFQYNMQLKQMESIALNKRDEGKEDRKDIIKKIQD